MILCEYYYVLYCWLYSIWICISRWFNKTYKHFLIMLPEYFSLILLNPVVSALVPALPSAATSSDPMAQLLLPPPVLGNFHKWRAGNTHRNNGSRLKWSGEYIIHQRALHIYLDDCSPMTIFNANLKEEWLTMSLRLTTRYGTKMYIVNWSPKFVPIANLVWFTLLIVD